METGKDSAGYGDEEDGDPGQLALGNVLGAEIGEINVVDETGVENDTGENSDGGDDQHQRPASAVTVPTKRKRSRPE